MAEPDSGTGSAEAALTVATRSRARQGRGATSTRAEYAREWAKYGAWCRPPAVLGRRERWLDPTATSPEQLLDYASALMDAGVAPGTIRKALAAIGSELRSRGLLVPDAVPATRLLRDYEDTREAAGRGAKHADPLLLDDLLRVLAVLDPGVAADVRDAAILHLMFAGLKVSELSRLVLGDFVAGVNQTPDRLEPVTMYLAGSDEETGRPARPRAVELMHWRSTTGTHDPRLCGACAVLRWYRRTAQLDGADPGWPYLRAVDKVGRLSGLDVEWAGRNPSGLRPLGVTLAFRRCLTRAGLNTDPRRLVPQSLRLGGVKAKLAQGGVGLGPFAAGGWSARSRLVVQMLEAFTPDGADRVALTVPGAGEETTSC